MSPSSTLLRQALCATLLVFVALSLTSAQENPTPPRTLSLPPTGTYVAHWPQTPVTGPLGPQFPLQLTNRPRMFTLQLNTNGTFVAETSSRYAQLDGDLMRMLPDVERGTWQWDAQRREFHLKPGKFRFPISRLSVDPMDTRRLTGGTGFLEREPGS